MKRRGSISLNGKEYPLYYEHFLVIGEIGDDIFDPDMFIRKRDIDYTNEKLEDSINHKWYSLVDKGDNSHYYLLNEADTSAS